MPFDKTLLARAERAAKRHNIAQHRASEQRAIRDNEIQIAHSDGWPAVDIARVTGLDYNTVNKILRQGKQEAS